MTGGYAGYFSHKITTEKNRNKFLWCREWIKMHFVVTGSLVRWLFLHLSDGSIFWNWREIICQEENTYINRLIYLNMTIKLDIWVCWRDSGNRELKRDEEPRDEPRGTKRTVWGTTKKESDELWLLMVKLWSYAFL